MTGSRWKAAGLLAAIFLLGIAIGLAAAAAMAHSPRDGDRRPRIEQAVDHLARELDLRPEQRARVHAVLERHRPAMESLWREFRPRMEALQNLVKADIEAELDPAQRQKFQELSRGFERAIRHSAKPDPDSSPERKGND